jgi:hypothetical protein
MSVKLRRKRLAQLRNLGLSNVRSHLRTVAFSATGHHEASCSFPAIQVGERSQPVKDLTACTEVPPERNRRLRG